jgi:hypothetical protein
VSLTTLAHGFLETDGRLRAHFAATARIAGAAWAGLCALGIGACSPVAPDDSADVVTTKTSAIANGTDLSELSAQTYNLAAVYHAGLNGAQWFPRPCSGMVVKATEDAFSYVMTARHCVTSDLSIDGPLAAPASIRVVPRAKPGLAPPPFDAVVADDIQAMPVTGSVETHDLAMIRVRANWAPLVRKHGFVVSAPETLVGRLLLAFGYGISEFNTACTDHSQNTVTTGAGIARSGSWFTVAGGSPPPPPPEGGGYYSFFNSNGGDPAQSIICGDSGGPDFVLLGAALQAAGVHSQGALSLGEKSLSTAANTWVQDTLGGMYLSPDSMANYNFAVNANWVPFLTTNDNNGRTLRFYPSTKRINAFGANRCLVPTNQAAMATCQDVALQRWDIGADRRIIHIDSGQCLTASGTSVFGAACDGSAAQRWQFHPQPSEPRLYTHCSNEYEQCNFTGTRDIRYGAFPNFVYRTLTNGTPCTNAVFGDPAVGVGKKCSIGLSGFTFCANEGGTCSFTGTRLVAYGANGTFIYRRFTNGAVCDNTQFTDPLVGVGKFCFTAAP